MPVQDHAVALGHDTVLEVAEVALEHEFAMEFPGRGEGEALVGGRTGCVGVNPLDALIREADARLEATAQWFTLPKKTRRALGIVAYNPQDLCFQLCFDLATERGELSAGANGRAGAAPGSPEAYG